MDYTIDFNAILPVVEEEVSRVASRSYSDDGSALYDGIKIVSRDEATLKRLLSDVTDVLLARFHDFVAAVSKDPNVVDFYLPDLPDYYEERIRTVLDRYVSMGIVGRWLQERGGSEFQMYLDRSEASITEAELLMVTRKKLEREAHS